jgi:hypothetical protein
MVPPLPAASRPSLEELALQAAELALVGLALQALVVGVAAGAQRRLVDGVGKLGVVEVESLERLGAAFRHCSFLAAAIDQPNAAAPAPAILPCSNVSGVWDIR